MNYPKELSEFYDWLDTNTLPKAAIALWYALMGVSNKARWPEKFTVAISTLEIKTGFKRSELFEARNILQKLGRIKWDNRGGNLAAEYEILSFCVHNTDANTDTVSAIRTQKGIQSVTVSAIRTQTPTQTGTINKLNKTTVESGSAAEPPPAHFAFEKKEIAFYNSLKPYLKNYGPEMLREFYDYWTEPNKSKTLMKWEQERTWDLNRRLKRWARNEKPKSSINGAVTIQKPQIDKIQQRTAEIAEQHRNNRSFTPGAPAGA